MISVFPAGLIAFANSLPPEIVLIVMAIVAFGGCLTLFRLFGAAGLYVFIAIAVIGANLQVTKLVQFGFFADPVALGTLLFAATYLATDILNERYGPDAARRGVWVGFASLLLWLVVLLVTLSFQPLGPDIARQTGVTWALDVQPAMLTLFQPVPALFLAGMAAYLVSQFLDIWVFDRLRRATAGRWLWLRNTGSTALSALVDNIVFSLLAWIIFAAEPLPLETVIMTYILGTYLFRLAAAIVDTPAMYIAKRVIPPPPVGLAAS